MRLLRLALLLGAFVLAVVAEWVSYESGDLAVVAADGVVGLVLVTCGFVACTLPGSTSQTAPIAACCGFSTIRRSPRRSARR